MSAAQPRREAVDEALFEARKVSTGRPALSPYAAALAAGAYSLGTPDELAAHIANGCVGLMPGQLRELARRDAANLTKGA